MPLLGNFQIAFLFAASVAMAVYFMLATPAQPKSEPAGIPVGLAPAWRAGVALGAGFAALLAYIFNFIGSSRPDAAHQMAILWSLMAAFGLANTLVVWGAMTLVKPNIRWHGDMLSFTLPDGRRVTRPLTDIAAILNEDSEVIQLVFRDGISFGVHQHSINLDPMLARYCDLMEALILQWQPSKPNV